MGTENMTAVRLDTLIDGAVGEADERSPNASGAGGRSPAASLVLEREAPAPLHSQISDAIRARIISSEWPPHYRLKPEPDLAAELGVSRGTLRRALATLLEEGRLRRVQGKGTFVASSVIEPAIAQRLSTLSEDFAEQGVLVTTKVLQSRLAPAPEHVAALLDLPHGAEVFELCRLRSSDGGPVALLVNYVRADLAVGVHLADFAKRSLFGVLETEHQLVLGSGRRTFSAQGATAETAAALGLEVGAPVQYLQQVTYLEDGRPVEYSDVWINSAKLRVTSVLSRRRPNAGAQAPGRPGHL